MISKFGTTDEYPSVYQKNVPPPKDRKILITGSVKDSQGNPIPGKDVWLRVLDPPDSSPYATPPTPGDNIDKDATSEQDPYTGSRTGGKLDNNHVNADGNGNFQTILNVIKSKKCTAQSNIDCAPSGDNYQIEGSFTSNYACSPNCTKTGIITAWKRVYLERDKMFRQGGLLAQDVNPPNGAARPTFVIVHNWANLPPCTNSPCYQIALFDKDNTYELPNSEKPWVGSVINLGSTLKLNLVNANNSPFPIQKNYFSSPYPTFGSTAGPPSIVGKSAGIGVISSGFYEFAYDTNIISGAYDRDAFVEVVIPPDIGALPYLPSPPDPNTFFDNPTDSLPKMRFSKIWFNKCGGGTDWVCGNNNNFHVMSVSGETHAFWGRSYMTNSHTTFGYNQTIEMSSCPLADISNCKQHTIAHEIAHQFEVNQCAGTGLGHDDRLAWCSTTQFMNYCGNSTDVQCILWSLLISQRTMGWISLIHMTSRMERVRSQGTLFVSGWI